MLVFKCIYCRGALYTANKAWSSSALSEKMQKYLQLIKNVNLAIHPAKSRVNTFKKGKIVWILWLMVPFYLFLASIRGHWT